MRNPSKSSGGDGSGKPVSGRGHDVKESFLDVGKIVLHALIIALIVRTFFYQPFNIPSGSMLETLRVGDYLFVSKISYGYTHYSLPFSPDLFEGRLFSDEPERGDVAVFRLPRDTSIDYIKRVVGLPGDRIQVIAGELHINGEKVERELVDSGTQTFVNQNGTSRTLQVTRYRETLPNGVSYITWDTNNSRGDNTAVYTVPDGEYFMMGDNRDNSTDSRFPSVGYVPLENFIGRADIIFFSTDKSAGLLEFWQWPWAIRWSRFFNVVN